MCFGCLSTSGIITVLYGNIVYYTNQNVQSPRLLLVTGYSNTVWYSHTSESVEKAVARVNSDFSIQWTFPLSPFTSPLVTHFPPLSRCFPSLFTPGRKQRDVVDHGGSNPNKAGIVTDLPTSCAYQWLRLLPPELCSPYCRYKKYQLQYGGSTLGTEYGSIVASSFLYEDQLPRVLL